MQINRLFEMIYILLDQETVTAKKMAERFEVSTRTIYRDIEILSGAGIPIYMKKGKGGGISLLPDFVLNKAVLTEEEKLDILASLRAVETVDLSETEMNTAVKKLGSLFGERNTDWIEVEFSSWENNEKEKRIFNSIKTGILKKYAMNLEYASGKGESVVRTVYPLKLCFKAQSWYMYGYCQLRADYRFFKLRRIREITLTDEKFTMEMNEKLFPGKEAFEETYIPLKIKLSKKMAFRVYDEFNNYKELDNGDFIIQLMFPKGEWLFNYIGSFGDTCEVLEPKEIREEVKSRLKNTLNKYL